MNATVNIALADLQELQNHRSKAEAEVAKLRQELASQKVEASDQTLLRAARAGIEITRFAVGHLPAECTKGWPIEALRSLVALLPRMPDATAHDDELAITLDIFAKECDVFERRRSVLAMMTP